MNEITKYPLFGKAYIVDDPFGGLAYAPPGKGYTTSPVIEGSPCKINDVLVMSDTPTTIFSSGTEADVWFSMNCYECKRYKQISTPLELRDIGGCALEFRLAVVGMDDGRIPFKTVRRIGFDSLRVSTSGLRARLSSCKEKVCQ